MADPQVLCLHGLGRNSADWDGVRPGLEAFGSVVTPQLSPINAKTFAAAAWPGDLSGTVIVGHSLGAVLALRLAAGHKIRGLILTGGFFPPARNGRNYAAAFGDYASHRVHVVRAMRRDGARPRASTARALSSLAGLGLRPRRFHEMAAQVMAKVLVIHGSHDHFVPFDFAMAATRAHSHWTFSLIERAGHNVHIDLPDQWLGVASPWLAEL